MQGLENQWSFEVILGSGRLVISLLSSQSGGTLFLQGVDTLDSFANLGFLFSWQRVEIDKSNSDHYYYGRQLSFFSGTGRSTGISGSIPVPIPFLPYRDGVGGATWVGVEAIVLASILLDTAKGVSAIIVVWFANTGFRDNVAKIASICLFSHKTVYLRRCLQMRRHGLVLDR